MTLLPLTPVTSDVLLVNSATSPTPLCQRADWNVNEDIFFAPQWRPRCDTTRYHLLRWHPATEGTITRKWRVPSASMDALWHALPWVWLQSQLNLSRTPKLFGHRHPLQVQKETQASHYEFDRQRQGCSEGTVDQNRQVSWWHWKWCPGQVSVRFEHISNAVCAMFSLWLIQITRSCSVPQSGIQSAHYLVQHFQMNYITSVA